MTMYSQPVSILTVTGLIATVLVCWGCLNKVAQTGGFCNRNVLCHVSGGGKYEIEVSAVLVLSEVGESFPCFSLASSGLLTVFVVS